MNEKEYVVVEKMQVYGGGFVKALAECFRCADNVNFRKLREAFPEYWENYEAMVSEDLKRKPKRI